MVILLKVDSGWVVICFLTLPWKVVEKSSAQY
jgi:hypothetical protein